MKTRLGEVLTGPAGTATEVLVALDPDDPVDWKGSVGAWFLECHGQAVGWHNYILATVHLRPIEGCRPPVITKAGSSHEVLLYACNPQVNPKKDDPATWSYLRPMNFVGQFNVPNDEKANELLKFLAYGVVMGELWAEPLLSGQKEPWATQVELLAEHMRGEHEDGN